MFFYQLSSLWSLFVVACSVRLVLPMIFCITCPHQLVYTCTPPLVLLRSRFLLYPSHHWINNPWVLNGSAFGRQTSLRTHVHNEFSLVCTGGSGYLQISALTTKMSLAHPWRSARLWITALASGISQAPSSTNSDIDDDDETFQDSTSEFASIVLSEKGTDCRG